jgi:hypothetical protein
MDQAGQAGELRRARMFRADGPLRGGHAKCKLDRVCGDGHAARVTQSNKSFVMFRRFGSVAKRGRLFLYTEQEAKDHAQNAPTLAKNGKV